MAEARKLTNAGATSFPTSNAVPTFDAAGNITMVKMSEIVNTFSLGSTGDFNDATTPGIYKVAGNGQGNSPEATVSRSMLIVMSVDANTKQQIVVNSVNGKMYVRTMWGGSWLPWKIVTLSEIAKSGG